MPSPKYTNEQRENIDIVINMTGCTREQATKSLTENNWDATNAILSLSNYTPETTTKKPSLNPPENIHRLREIIDEKFILYEKALGRK